jgi:hypothetical protein
MGRRRKRIFLAITPILTVAVCLAMLFGFFAYRAYMNPLMKSDVRLEGDFLIEEDGELGFVTVRNGYSIRSHLDSDLRYHLITDHRGARVNSADHQTPDAVDVMVIGGSYAWGHGVENEYTFAERLRRKLNVSVANFAMGSYGTLQSLQILRRNMDLRPKVVIYAIIEDHIRRNLSPCAPSYAPFCMPVSYIDFDEDNRPFIRPPRKEYFSIDRNRKYYKEVLMREGFHLKDASWQMRIDLFNLFDRKKLAYYNDLISRQLSMRYLMKEMADAARSIDAKLVVMYIPKLVGRRDVKGPPRELLYSIANLDMTFIDLAPAIIEYYRDESNPLLGIKLDYHPTVRAHEMMSEKIAEVLTREYLLGRE